MNRKVCAQCGSTEDVHRGWCRRCRKILVGKAQRAETASPRAPKAPHLEPPHSRPWVHRLGG